MYSLEYKPMMERERGKPMPAKDRTGPEGEGARTGRAAGDCSDTVESKTPIDGARGGFGRGGGRRGS
ncbi:MAG: DUF5320 domain-containing protein, partial [Anaerolineales bacterium]|nr:DUF5320 domain-containing protein [Anaerolineales bacterium]